MPLNTAPTSIAVLAETTLRSLSRPAGNAPPAWNPAHMLASQNASDSVQPYFSSSVPSTAPQPYSNTLTAIMATQGSQTIQLRERPMMTVSVFEYGWGAVEGTLEEKY